MFKNSLLCLSVLLLIMTSAWSTVTIKKSDDYRIFYTDSMPHYTVTGFPQACCPNTATKQSITVKVPLHPVYEKKTYDLVIPNKFGIMLDGVIVEPNADEYWSKDHSTPCQKNDSQEKSAWPYAALSDKVTLGFDTSHAHVQHSGLYHYHGVPTRYIAELDKSSKTHMDAMPILGYAADGFPIYFSRAYKDPKDSKSPVVTLTSSYQLKKGSRASGEDKPGGVYDGRFTTDYEYVAGSGDLDECNGRAGVTPDYPKGTYYYVITKEYPWVGRCFHAKPDDSFSKDNKGLGGGSRRGRPPFVKKT